MTVLVEQRQTRTLGSLFTKYFLHGQNLIYDERQVEFLTHNDGSFDSKILKRFRKFFSFLIPFCVAQFIWWTVAFRFDFLPLYATLWQLPVTMVLGATVAGMTAEGSGAVIFPVMTFVLNLTPNIARDFTVAIQSVGMSCAAFSILFMRVQVEWRAIFYSFVGAVPGAVFGFFYVDPNFSAAQKKMFFVSVWSAFAMSLYMLNCEKKRLTVPWIQHFCAWKAMALVLAGFVGGIFTSFAGSGVDICAFSLITSLFRVSEKTATPSTVILMAITSQFCFFWRGVVVAELDALAFDYFKICVPVVVFFAPFGSFLGSHFHRLTLAWAVCILEVVSMAGFLATLPPWPLLLASAVLLTTGFALFSLLSDAGAHLMERELRRTRPKCFSLAAANEKGTQFEVGNPLL